MPATLTIPLYDASGNVINSKGNILAVQQNVPILLCPSDPMSSQKPDPGFGPRKLQRLRWQWPKRRFTNRV